MADQAQEASTVAPTVTNTPAMDAGLMDAPAPVTDTPATTNTPMADTHATDSVAEQETTDHHGNNPDIRSPFERIPYELKLDIIYQCDDAMDRAALAYTDREYYYAFLQYHAEMGRVRYNMPDDDD